MCKAQPADVESQILYGTIFSQEKDVLKYIGKNNNKILPPKVQIEYFYFSSSHNASQHFFLQTIQ